LSIASNTLIVDPRFLPAILRRVLPVEGGGTGRGVDMSSL